MGQYSDRKRRFKAMLRYFVENEGGSIQSILGVRRSFYGVKNPNPTKPSPGFEESFSNLGHLGVYQTTMRYGLYSKGRPKSVEEYRANVLKSRAYAFWRTRMTIYTTLIKGKGKEKERLAVIRRGGWVGNVYDKYSAATKKDLDRSKKGKVRKEDFPHIPRRPNTTLVLLERIPGVTGWGRRPFIEKGAKVPKSTKGTLKPFRGRSLASIPITNTRRPKKTGPARPWEDYMSRGALIERAVSEKLVRNYKRTRRLTATKRKAILAEVSYRDGRVTIRGGQD